MSTSRACTVCGKTFEPRFRFQIEEDAGRTAYYCSQRCQQQAVLSSDSEGVDCSACSTRFKLEFAYQVVINDQGRRYFCTEACRSRGAAVPGAAHGRRIAVFNHKGGTGKTTTAISVAAGLAARGKRVLLVDVDAQGNVGVALGVRGPKTMYHVLVLGTDPMDAAISTRTNIDVITSNETLAAAELYLAARPNRDRVLRERMLGADAYDFVILDCSPSLSLLNQNALVYADSVLIPVSCDYLALVGVKQVIKTLANVYEHLKHPVHILGVVPTFYDSRHRIGREVVDTLKAKFGDLCFPPVRSNIRLREAPATRQSIFEYAPESHGAEDYSTVVSRVIESAVVSPVAASSAVPSAAPDVAGMEVA